MAGRGWRISAAPKLKSSGAVFVLTRDKIAGEFEGNAKNRSPGDLRFRGFCFYISSF
jgi:hypothetical protein